MYILTKNIVCKMQTNENKEVLYKHISVVCWSTGSKAYSHSQIDCQPIKQKMNKLGHESYVHLTRFVNNSSYNKNHVQHLYCMSKM